MNTKNINLKPLALAWIFVQIIFALFVIGGGLFFFLGVNLNNSTYEVLNPIISLISFVFWLLFMYIAYFFYNNKLNYKELFKKSDIGLVRSFHRFSYYLLFAFPTNIILLTFGYSELLVLKINAVLAFPFCIWSFVTAILFYSKKNMEFSLPVEDAPESLTAPSVLKFGTNYAKNLSFGFLWILIAMIVAIAIVVIGGDKATPVAAVVATAIPVIVFYRSFKKTLK